MLRQLPNEASLCVFRECIKLSRKFDLHVEKRQLMWPFVFAIFVQSGQLKLSVQESGRLHLMVMDYDSLPIVTIRQLQNDVLWSDWIGKSVRGVRAHVAFEEILCSLG